MGMGERVTTNKVQDITKRLLETLERVVAAGKDKEAGAECSCGCQ